MCFDNYYSQFQQRFNYCLVLCVLVLSNIDSIFLFLGFSRAVVSACVCSILVLLVRLQFSIVAAYLFCDKDSIVSVLYSWKCL